jgi:hypothetical protein
MIGKRTNKDIQMAKSRTRQLRCSYANMLGHRKVRDKMRVLWWKEYESKKKGFE